MADFQLQIWDFIDILVIAFILYQVLLLIKGTRGWQMTLGITSVFFFYYLSLFLELRTIGWLLERFFTYFIFALIVIFQSEIRRGLAQIGRGRFFLRLTGKKPQDLPETDG
jgi:diadenylate cyclase